MTIEFPELCHSEFCKKAIVRVPKCDSSVRDNLL